MPSATPLHCPRQPTCPGHIDPHDGYCTHCGAPADIDAATGQPAPPSPGTPDRQRPDRPENQVRTAPVPGNATPVDRRAREARRIRRRPLDISRLTRTAATTTPRALTQIGDGIVNVDPAPAVDPMTTLMANPALPPDRRWCSTCELHLARVHGPGPAPVTGHCPNCRSQFDARPPLLRSGTDGESTVIGGGFEVVGALSYGGMGWVYLAWHQGVQHWRVLKGLLDPTDDSTLPEQIAIERGYLKDLVHPGIVGVIDLPVHDDQAYLAMEWVNGRNLDQIAVGAGGRLDVTTAAAYVLAALPALSYLHRRDLIFCDFKPENIIHTGDTVQLIDIGGVWKLNSDAEVLGTVGFAAPEIENGGAPTVASDLYTVGRTLAVLTLDWPEHDYSDGQPPWVSTYRHRLPDPADEHLLADHDCLWRFFERACAHDPADRFESADEMAEALRGVLSQVASARRRAPHPYSSGRWEAPHPTLEPLDGQTLPEPHLPRQARSPNRIAGLTDDPDLILWVAAEMHDQLSWADAGLAAFTVAAHRPEDHDWAYRLTELLGPDGTDSGYDTYLSTTRSYLNGVIALVHGDLERACRELDRAYAEAPGEPICALAYAAALERAGGRDRTDEAAHLYLQVAATDPTWSSAVAGLARTLYALGRPNDAAHVLADTIRPGHPLRAASLTLACRYMAPSADTAAPGSAGAGTGARIDEGAGTDEPVGKGSAGTGNPGDGHDTDPDDAVDENLSMFDAAERAVYDGTIAEQVAAHLADAPPGGLSAPDAELALALYTAALRALDAPNPRARPKAPVNGVPPERDALADATARALVDLADATPNRGHKHQLLDRAARTRTWRWW